MTLLILCLSHQLLRNSDGSVTSQHKEGTDGVMEEKFTKIEGVAEGRALPEAPPGGKDSAETKVVRLIIVCVCVYVCV